MSPESALRTVVDRFGALWSMLCAVHCAVLPLVLVLAPGFALGVWWDDQVERITVILVSLVASASLGLGFVRHRGWTALALMTPGLLLMWAALLLPAVHHSVPAHAAAMATGGVLVAMAHLANLRLGRGHIHGPQCVH